jgi:hypothetical protein
VVISKRKIAKRNFRMQDVPALQFSEDMPGEYAARNVADMKQRTITFLWRIGHREIPTFAVLQNEAEVLPGFEFNSDARWKTQMHKHDVVGDPL